MTTLNRYNKLVTSQADSIIQDLFEDVDELMTYQDHRTSEVLDGDQIINSLFLEMDRLLESDESVITESLDEEPEGVKTSQWATPQPWNIDHASNIETLDYQPPGEITPDQPHSVVSSTPPVSEAEEVVSPKKSVFSSLRLPSLNKLILYSSGFLLVLAAILFYRQYGISQVGEVLPVDQLEEVADSIPPNNSQPSPEANQQESETEFAEYMEQVSTRIYKERQQAREEQKQSEIEKLKEGIQQLKQGQEQLRQHQLAQERKLAQTRSTPVPQPSNSRPSPSPQPSSQSQPLPPPPQPSQSEPSSNQESDNIPSLPSPPSNSESEQVFGPTEPPQSETSSQTGYELVGVLELDDKGSAALMKGPKTTQRVMLGENLPGSGWKLLKVENQTAIFEQNGNQKSLAVGEQLLTD